jgi:hypothetical protein
VGSYKDNHKGAARVERTMQVCLRGDLVGDWEAAERELERARQAKDATNAKEATDLGPLIERVRSLEAEMLEHAETWRLRAMPRYRFRKLVAAHPPRRDENGEPVEEDRLIGLNRSEFFPRLVRACVVEPKLDEADWLWLLGHTDEEQERLKAEGNEDEIEEGLLTDRQVSDLQDVAWFLNRGEVEVPFSHAASLASRDSGGE